VAKRFDRRTATPGVTPGLGRPDVDLRRGRTLPHLRARTPDTVTWPSRDDGAVQDIDLEVPPASRSRRYLNDPPDTNSVQPAGVRAFDSEGPIPARGTRIGDSLPEAKIVRVAATGAIAHPYEYEHDRYVTPVPEKRTRPRRNPRR
jgi:hypothetical protein